MNSSRPAIANRCPVSLRCTMEADCPPDSDLQILLAQARAGSRDALIELFETHRLAMRLLIRKRLSQPLRRQFDSEDFTQQIAMKLWTHAVPPEVFASDPTFVAYLSTMARNILHDHERRHLLPGKRDMHREVALADAGGMTDRPDVQAHAQEARENYRRWERSLLPMPRRIVQLMRQGKTQL